MHEAITTIKNKAGIHAIPASIFIKKASEFHSKIQIKAKGKTIDGKSVFMIMSLGLSKGDSITISADGVDEVAAVNALKELVDSKFGEE